MQKASEKLKGFNGANPFHESQAKAYSDEKIAHEFFPISLYWSLFNEQHEILLGTRGSGKTVILRMLSYSCLRKFRNQKAEEIYKSKKFIGFYIPIYLEWLASLRGKNYPDEERIEYFEFAVNCLAATKLINELKALLEDLYPKPQDRLAIERKLLSRFRELWFSSKEILFSSLSDVQWHITILYEKTRFWRDGELDENIPLARPLFTPLVSVLPYISEDLGLSPDSTNWIACVDEAEFIKAPFLKCFNSFMRSQKKPIILKMATFPFKHETRETLTEGVFVEPYGNDYNYRLIDMQSDHVDFVGLTNHILSTRLANCGLVQADLTLESFLGTIENDELHDYFRQEMSDEDTSQDAILKEILQALSESRRLRFETLGGNKASVRYQYFNRFSPVYYVRRMFIENSKGNRTPGWFAGAKTVRRIADGNPRRFIQIMHDLFESAREMDLDPRNQHRVITDFAKRLYRTVEGLPKYGLLLKAMLDAVGSMLHKRVHGINMVDGGSHFHIQEYLLNKEIFIAAVKLGSAYSWLFCDEKGLYEGIKSDTDIRLAYLCSVKFWLPMRKGDPVMLKAKESEELFALSHEMKPPINSKISEAIIKQLDLQIAEIENEK